MFLIKIIYGLRRSGKSVIQFIMNLQKEDMKYILEKQKEEKYVISIDKLNFSRNGIKHNIFIICSAKNNFKTDRFLKEKMV